MLSVQSEQLQDMDNNRYHPDGFDPRFLDDFNHVSLKFLLKVIFFILGRVWKLETTRDVLDWSKHSGYELLAPVVNWLPSCCSKPAFLEILRQFEGKMPISCREGWRVSRVADLMQVCWAHANMSFPGDFVQGWERIGWLVKVSTTKMVLQAKWKRIFATSHRGERSLWREEQEMMWK